MNIKHLILLASTICVDALAVQPSALTPHSISEDTKRIGAKAEVQRLYSSNQWETVLKKVGSSDASWLAVVNDLAEGTDAGTSEDLQVSLATALPRNPGAVLRLADTKNFLSLRDICAAPFIEPEHEFLMRYLTDARKALVRLNDKAVEGKRLKCLSHIEHELADEEKRVD